MRPESFLLGASQRWCLCGSTLVDHDRYFVVLKGKRLKPSTKAQGDGAEKVARRYLEKAGLAFVTANYRTPGRGGGEIDLVMQLSDKAGKLEKTLVFVEVRQRSSAGYGGAAASISSTKQRRIVFAARHYLLRFGNHPPPCRFDVVLLQGSGAGATVEWMPGAFDAPC